MRPAAVIKGVGFALLLAVAVFGSSVALAEDPGCIQACADRWFADKQACLDDLNAAYANIDANTEACINNCAPSNFLCQANCVRTGNLQRRAAENDYRYCVNVANTIAWNCYRACVASKSKP